MLYDSGAQLCLLSKKAFRNISVHQRPRKLDLKLTCSGVSGSKLKLLGCYLLELHVLGKKIIHPFFVSDHLPGKYEGVIGIDLIKKHGLSYDAISNQPYFEKPEKLLSVATLSKNVYLPARCSTKVKLDMPFDHLQTMMVDIPGCHQIFPSEYLLEPKNGHSICYLMNTSYTPQKLPRGTMVGKCEKIEEKELSPFDLESTTPKSNSVTVPPQPNLTSDRRRKIQKMAQLGHLSAKNQESYLKLLYKYHKALSLSEFELGCCKLGAHNIPTKEGCPPSYSKQFPLGYEQEVEVNRQIEEWIRLGLVKEVESSYNTALFCIPKKSPPQRPGEPPPKKSFRVVADCRHLNNATIDNNFRLPLISETFDRIASKKPVCFTSLDLRSGFTQLPIDESSQHKTAFTNLATGTQYMFTRTLQGLKNAPCSFHRVMVRVFKKILAKGCCEVYLDDILLFNKNHEEHLSTLDESLSAIQDSGMLINLEKCEFGVDKLTYLGFEMDKAGYRPDPRKMKSIMEMKMPETLRSVRGLLGFAGFYRHLIPRFSQLVRPLTYLTCKEAKYTGGPMPKDAVNVFRKLQEIFTSQPFIHFPDFALDFHIYVDASLGNLNDPRSGGLAGCCVQFENNDTSNPPKPIGFCSRSLQLHERNYTVSMIETLGLIFSVEYFEKYLRKKFYIHSDHLPLAVCKTYHKRTISRFREILANYDFEIIYEKGETMVSDYPSRHVGSNEKDIALITSEELYKELESFEVEKVQPQKLQTRSVKLQTANEKEGENSSVTSEKLHKELESFEVEKVQLQNVQTRSTKLHAANSAKSVSDAKCTHQNVWGSQHAVHATNVAKNYQPMRMSSLGECKNVVDRQAGNSHAECTLLAELPHGETVLLAGSSCANSSRVGNNGPINMLAEKEKSIECAPEKKKKKDSDNNKFQVASLKTVGEFNLGIQYEPELDRKLLIGQQSSDPFIQQLKIFIEHKKLPKARYRNIIKRFGPNAFIKNGLVMIKLEREGFQTKDLLVLPACRHAEMIAMGHSGKVGGHSKTDKTANRLLEFCWWPGIWSDIQFFIDECDICKRMKKKSDKSNTYLKPLPQCSLPLECVHLDLKGPINDKFGKKSYIMVCVDSFTKYAIFKKVEDKKPETIAQSFYDNFICQFSAPLRIISDQGLEFTSKMFKELCNIMQIEKLQTSAYRPQTNSSAEVLNRHLGKYLQALVLEKGGTWEDYLSSAQHCYNMSIHAALKASPFSILFGLPNPNSPINSAKFNNTPLYGENVQHELANRLRQARALAKKNNMKFRDDYVKRFDKKVLPHQFSRGHLVYLHRPELLEFEKKSL